jgi:hypothetical protein
MEVTVAVEDGVHVKTSEQRLLDREKPHRVVCGSEPQHESQKVINEKARDAPYSANLESSALEVTRTVDDVVLRGQDHETADVVRIVAEVRVHENNDVTRGIVDAGPDRCREPFLVHADDQFDGAMRERTVFSYDIGCSVRAVVVHDNDLIIEVEMRENIRQLLDEINDVLAFVIGWEYDGHLHDAAGARRKKL